MAKKSTKKQKTTSPAAARAKRMRRSRLRSVAGGLLRMFGKLAPIGLAVGALYGAWWGLGEWKTFSVQRVAVRSNLHAGAEDILALSNLSSKDNLFRIDCGEIKDRVESHPWISQAAVYRRFPSTVVIDVSEWRPVMAANSGEGTLHLISDTGEVFKPAALSEASGLPLLAGLSETELTRGGVRAREGIANALDVLALSRKQGIPGGGAISEIEIIGAGADVAVLFSGEGRTGPYVLMGPPPFEEKWQRLGRLWSDLDSRDVQPARIQFVSDARAVVVLTGRGAAKI